MIIYYIYFQASGLNGRGHARQRAEPELKHGQEHVLLMLRKILNHYLMNDRVILKGVGRLGEVMVIAISKLEPRSELTGSTNLFPESGLRCVDMVHGALFRQEKEPVQMESVPNLPPAPELVVKLTVHVSPFRLRNLSLYLLIKNFKVNGVTENWLQCWYIARVVLDGEVMYMKKQGRDKKFIYFLYILLLL